MTAPADPASSHPLRDRWGRMGVGKRIVVAAVAAVFVVNIGVAALQSVIGGGDPGGPVSSSFTTGADGFGAWADLLTERGHSVVRLRMALPEARLDRGSTLVLADPRSLQPDDVRAVVRFERAGGRVVLGGENTTPVLQAITGEPVQWAPIGVERAGTLVPLPETAAVERVEASGQGRYDGVGGLLPIIGGGGRVLAVLASAGPGSVVGLADTGVLQNRRLDRADNAALALAVVGPNRRTVVFAESVHGFGASTGLDALPSSWKWAGLFLLFGAALGMWAFGQRLGPPEDARRPLRPPRRDYVDALAADLARVSARPRGREETNP